MPSSCAPPPPSSATPVVLCRLFTDSPGLSPWLLHLLRAYGATNPSVAEACFRLLHVAAAGGLPDLRMSTLLGEEDAVCVGRVLMAHCAAAPVAEQGLGYIQCLVEAMEGEVPEVRSFPSSQPEKKQGTHCWLGTYAPGWGSCTVYVRVCEDWIGGGSQGSGEGWEVLLSWA